MCIGDASDKRFNSGSSFHLRKLLAEECGFDVDLIDKLRPEKITPGYLLRSLFSGFCFLFLKERFAQFFWNLLGKNHSWERTLAFSEYYARLIQKKLKKIDADIIFADKASIAIACLDTPLPIVYSSDATFKAMNEYYPAYSNWSPAALKYGNQLEELALKKASIFLCCTDWAARSAVGDYGISEDKIRVLPMPAILSAKIDKSASLTKKSRDVCRLLFVGVDWDRKGGDIAVDSVRWLNKNGISSRLVICGCVPPEKYLSDPCLEIVGFLDKNQMENEQKLVSLYLSAHFFILPTRAECQAHAIAEAAAFGLPIISTETGGVSTLLGSEQNGVLLSVDAPGAEYGRSIKEIWQNPLLYENMRSKSRQVYETRLSDSVWSRNIKNIIGQLINRKHI